MHGQETMFTPPLPAPQSFSTNPLSLLSRSTRSPARKRSRFKKNSPTGTNLPIFPLFSFLLNFISNTRTAHNTESTRRRRYSISPAVRGREYDIYLLAVPTLVLVSRKNSARVFFYSIATRINSFEIVLPSFNYTTFFTTMFVRYTTKIRHLNFRKRNCNGLNLLYRV